MTRLLTCLSVAFLLAACSEPGPESDDSASPASATAESAPEQPERIQVPPLPAEGFRIARYREDLKTLSSDEFRGRAPGTRGERRSLDYLVDAFHDAGIEPGYGDSYLQPVPMVELTNQERSALEIAGGDDGMTLEYPEQMIIGSRRGGTEPHAIDDSELVFAGYGIVAPEYDWDDYAGLDVEGKTVVVLVNDPGFANPDAGIFNGRAMTYYGRWTYKYEEAARQGADAALIVHQTEPASYPWEVVINSWSGAQFELAEAGDEPIMALEGWLTVDAAGELFRRAGKDFDESSAAAAEPGFRAEAMDLRVSASVRNSVREGVSYNVLGRIPGTERPDEAVIYTAHWDHLGQDLSRSGSAGIYNGAIDNAAGTAGLLEIARLFREGEAPERSVLFAAVTLEEYGLLGSRHYVNDPVFDHADTAAVINMDAVNYMAGPTEDMIVVGHGSSELEDILAEMLAAEDRRIEPERSPEAGFYYRSDHFNFARVGIPALYARGGFEHRERGFGHMEELARDYRDNRYHKTGDEFDPDWDFRGVAEDLEALYRVGRHVADSGDWPNWYEGNEFRALRTEQGR